MWKQLILIVTLCAMADRAVAQPQKTPSQDAKKAIEVLLKNTGKLERGTYLGVASTPVSAAMREQLKLKLGVGLVVDRVEKDSPAEQAGIKQYDILEKLDDQWLINSEQLAALVRMQEAGKEVKLSVIRQGQPQTITAKLIMKDVAPLPVSPGIILFKDGSNLPGQLQLKTDMLQSGSGRITITSPNEVTVTKQDNSYSISMTRKGDSTLMTAIDATGNVLFDGPLDTDEQWKGVPPDIEPMARKMVADMKTNTIRGKIGR